MAIYQDLSSGGVSLVKVDVPNIPTNGNILTASTSVDGATNITFTQTTANIVAVLLNPTITTVNKTITLQNLVASTQSLTINCLGGDSFIIGIGQSIEVTWNGTSWKLLNPVQLLAEYGSQNLSGTFNNSLTTIGTFIIPSAGVWEIDYQVYGTNSLIGEIGIAVYNSSSVQETGSVAGSGVTVSAGGSTAVLANKFYLTTIVSGTYTVKGKTSAGIWTVGTGSTPGLATQGNSKVSFQKISGNLSTTGTIVDFSSSTQSTTIPTGAVDVTWVSPVGNIVNNGTLFTLIAGRTYRLEASLGLNFNTGSTSNASYRWVDSSNVTIGANEAVTYNQVSGGTGDSIMGVTAVIYSPMVNTQVKVRITGSGAVGGATINRCNLSIVQIGTTASIENQSISISNLSTGGVIQSTTVNPYVVGFNVAQTTSNQVLSIPLPVSTNINRIIYINNIGTVSFTISGIVISAGQSGAFIWNGTIWSVFSAQTSGSVISEFGENNAMTDGQTSTSTSFADVVGGSFTLPSAGVWRVNYNIFTKNSSAAGLVKFILTDANNVIVPNSNASYEQVTGVDIIAPVGQISFITTTGSVTYKLRWLVSTSTGTIYNNGSLGSIESGNSKITYQKVSGYLPVIGQSVDFVSLNRTSSQTTGILIGSRVLFTNTIDGNLSNVNGIITLQANKTYQLIGSTGIIGGDRGLSVRWRNLLTGLLVGSEAGSITPTAGNSNAVALGTANAIITTNAITTVQLEIVNFFGGVAPTAIGFQVDQPQSSPYASVVQLGSSAYTSLSPLMLSSSQVTGILPIVNGGTGSTTQNFIDLTTVQSIAGAKTFTNNLTVTGTNTATSFIKSAGLVSQNLLADGTTFDKYNNSTSTATYFQSTTTTATLVDGMSITPPLAGTYKVDFNTQFNTQLANITQQAVLDLNALYLSLNGQGITGVFPVLTAGMTISPGVYYTPAAVAVTGTITLDGLGNANAIFIFRTDAAFSTSASCVFNLVNGAVAKNVFFIAGGAITIGASSNISGTFISPSAPINIGTSAYINGRFYSIGSAITVNGSVILSPASTIFPMGVLANFILFTTAGAVTSSGINTFVGDVGTNVGTVTGFGSSTLSGNIYLPNQGASLISISIYIDNVLIPVTTRERTNTIDKTDVILTETVTLTAGQLISIKVLNSIGISRFYNRNLTITKI